MRLLRPAASLLARPFVAAALASLMTALVMGTKPPEVHTVERITQQIPGITKVIHETRYVCDPGVTAKLSNTNQDSSARTGTASFDNETASSSDPSGGVRASGDTSAAAGQSAVASSGDAVNGQINRLTATGCGKVVANLTNTCIDCRAETGDASAENDAQVDVGGERLASSPTPSPEIVEVLVASPTPSASATAVIEPTP